MVPPAGLAPDAIFLSLVRAPPLTNFRSSWHRINALRHSDMAPTRRGVFLSLSGLAALPLAGVTGRAALARYYDGPISDHFDGTFFIDPHGAQPKSIVDLVRWWGSRGGERWPAWAPSPYR